MGGRKWREGRIRPQAASDVFSRVVAILEEPWRFFVVSPFLYLEVSGGRAHQHGARAPRRVSARQT